MVVTSGFQRSWVHSHSIMPRVPRQRAMHIIDNVSKNSPSERHGANGKPSRLIEPQGCSAPNGDFYLKLKLKQA
jgi:hypothetical protein